MGTMIWQVSVGMVNGEREATWLFNKPPTRTDFVRTLRLRYPWTEVWDHYGFFGALENVPWPVVDFMHKSSSIEVSAARTWKVEVSYIVVHEATGYDRAGVAISYEMERRAIKGLRKRDDESIRDWQAIRDEAKRIQSDMLGDATLLVPEGEARIVARLRAAVKAARQKAREGS